VGDRAASSAKPPRLVLVLGVLASWAQSRIVGVASFAVTKVPIAGSDRRSNLSPFTGARLSPLVVRVQAAAAGRSPSSPSRKGGGSGRRAVAVNRLAYRNYEIVETYEAGIALAGTEVKAIRDGKLNLRDGYVRPSRDGRSCVLHNVHVGKHSTAGAYFQHEERRPRSLLVHRREARKLLQQTEARGMTVVPLKAYFNDSNKLKIEIALCRGKNVRDKRATIKERDAKREESRIIKSFRV
jgi:SsrA-binding protein